jgi:hypothetical protein
MALLRNMRYIKQTPPDNGKDCVRNLFKADLHGSCWNKLIRRCLYVDNDIHYFEGVNIWEDLISSMQLLFFAKKIAYLPEAFLHYRKTNIDSYTNISMPWRISLIFASLKMLFLFNTMAWIAKKLKKL